MEVMEVRCSRDVSFIIYMSTHLHNLETNLSCFLDMTQTVVQCPEEKSSVWLIQPSSIHVLRAGLDFSCSLYHCISGVLQDMTLEGNYSVKLRSIGPLIRLLYLMPWEWKQAWMWRDAPDHQYQHSHSWSVGLKSCMCYKVHISQIIFFRVLLQFPFRLSPVSS